MWTIDLSRKAQILAACTRSFGHPPRSVREGLQALLESTGPDEKADRYGGGNLLEQFEAQIAELLGKEAAVFMPSGTMAQQIALRLHAEETGNDRVALHPQSHLIMSEEDAYQRLSGLRGTPVGDPHRLFTLADLETLKEKPGTLLIELPERNIGGWLRPWDELQMMAGWAHGRGIRLHMDGARLWETQPYYSPPDSMRPYAEIAAAFDTVYVSFYKILNGIAGAALAGTKALIDRARLWQQRYGGRLVQMYPYVIAARAGLDRYLPRMRAYRDRALEIASVLRTFDEILIAPDPPHTNMMHVSIRGNATALEAAMVEIAEQSGVALFGSLTHSAIPGYHTFERAIGEGAFEISDAEIAVLFARLLKLSESNTLP